ncbi:MAG: YceI family protein [Gemmatimonadales bacterium]
MRRTVLTLLLCGAASGAPLAAQGKPLVPSRVAEGTLSFDARATAGDFTGTTSTVTGGMTGGATLAEVRGCVQAPVNTLVTGNGRRDRDLNKSMETDTFPTMRFALNRVAPTSATGDSMTADLIGDLTLHGVTLPDTLPATLLFRGDSVRVHADFPVNVKDYGVRGLSKLLGLLKMDEHIVVHVDVVFVPGAGGCEGEE